jgi:hypothetical protein
VGSRGIAFPSELNKMLEANGCFTFQGGCLPVLSFLICRENIYLKI